MKRNKEKWVNSIFFRLFISDKFVISEMQIVMHVIAQTEWYTFFFFCDLCRNKENSLRLEMRLKDTDTPPPDKLKHKFLQPDADVSNFNCVAKIDF